MAEKYQRRRHRARQVLQVLLVTLISYYIIYISAYSSFLSGLGFLFYFYGLQLLTMTFIAGVYLAILALINRNWIATSLILILSILFSYINHVKMDTRNEPFLPSDLAMAKNIPDLIKMVSFWEVLLILVGIGAIIILTMWVFHKQPLFFKKEDNQRWYSLAAAVLICGSYISINSENSPISKLATALGNDPIYWDPSWGVQRNGPILNFVNYTNTKIMTEPSGYSKKAMLAIQKKYSSLADSLNDAQDKTSLKNTDVVMILSESFSDPTMVPGVKLNKDPMPFTRKLMAQTPSGYMMSNGYGGGTANMEYQSLSSMALGNFSPSLITPYTQLVPKLRETYTVNNSFNEGIALHPYDGDMYNRDVVLPEFGFSKFYNNTGDDKFPYYWTYEKNPYITDQAAYSALLKEMKTRRAGNFYHLITIQNHMPYLAKYYTNNKFKATGNFSKTEQSEIETFANGIHITDKANKYLISQLSKLKRNVIVIYYGDHLPGIYAHVDFAKYGMLMHKTPFFVWSNHTQLDASKSQPIIGSYELSTAMYDVANAKLTPFYALMSQVNNSLPVITTNTFTNADSNLMKTGKQLVNQQNSTLTETKYLTKQQRTLLHDYQLVQYDFTSGKQYILKRFTK